MNIRRSELGPEVLIGDFVVIDNLIEFDSAAQLLRRTGRRCGLDFRKLAVIFLAHEG